MCDEVAEQVTTSLADVSDAGERTEQAMQALFERVCRHLGLDPDRFGATLGPSAGFRLMQTLEEHMEPDFPYSGIIDERLLMRL